MQPCDEHTFSACGVDAQPLDVRIEVPLEPVAKARPRAAMVAGHMRVYTPKRTAKFEAQVAMLAAGLLSPAHVAGRPVRVDILAVLPRPQRLCGQDRRGQPKHPQGLIPAPVRPDRDNLAKSVLDGLRHLLGDDACVVSGDTLKAYAEVTGVPRVLIRVRTITAEQFAAAVVEAFGRAA